MNFREWLKLQEIGTGTNAIAIFARPAMGMVRRGSFDDLWLGGRPVGDDGEDHPHKKKKKKKHKKRDHE